MLIFSTPGRLGISVCTIQQYLARGGFIEQALRD